MDEYDEDIKKAKKFFLWFVIVLFSIAIASWFLSTSAKVVETGIIRYEEYLEIYQTCEKLNTDLCNIKDLPDNDKMFDQFSKTQRIFTTKTQLNRWVEEYNAKSKMINRSLWKANELPYQLSVKQFNCY